MLDTFLPKKINYFLDLIRFKKPIGFTLLMWPCWFALASLEEKNINQIYWYIIFFLGSFTMRSAGCIINDLIDINLDKKVERTSNRPLASKKISIKEALFFLIFLLSISFIILLNFNFKSIILGLLSFPLVIIYPFMKRFTYWPQLFLGLIFNWGILIVSMQFYGFISFETIVLYLGCVFWTLGYDTIYAYQDKDDDKKSGIKSTAVLFGEKGKLIVMLFYTIFIIFLGYLGYTGFKSFLAISIILLYFVAMILIINKWNIRSKVSSNYFFNLNNYLGFFVFIYLLYFN